MHDPTNGGSGPLARRFEQLNADRQQFINIARTCSALTLPTLFPQNAGTGAKPRQNTVLFKTPWQAMGARGVNNLASKLLLALLPPNQPFFKFEMLDSVIDDLSRGEAKVKAEVESALAKIERGITKKIESTAMRVPIFLALKHLIVTGNYLLYLPPEGGARGFRLDRFCVKRDPMGTVVELIVQESLDPQTVPENIRGLVKERMGINELNERESDTVDIYTRILRKDDRYTISQECAGVQVPNSTGRYPLDASPWLPLRWHKVDGEDYGRGHVEEYVGDLKSLEALSQAIVEGSATAARMIFLVKPGTSTKVADLENLPNGGIAYGNAEDVTVVQSQKQADLRVASETAEKIKEQLAYAFMLNTAIQRPGERVTAEEIRFMAGELEDTLGGVYSIQSQELQLPLVRRVQLQMEKQGEIPTLPKQAVKPTIVTGLEAIGRGQDLTRYQGFVSDLEVLAKVDPAIAASLDGSVLMERMATARGIDVKDLIKSEEQMQADQQAAQQQQLMQQATPEMMKAGGNIVTEVAKGMMANGGQGIQGGPGGQLQGGGGSAPPSTGG